MLTRYLLLLLLVGLLPACSSQPETETPLRLRVLSYNIHHGRGSDGKIDLERLAQVIRRADPDLVALQEVDVETKRSGGVNQPLALDLGSSTIVFSAAMPFDGGHYGNALIARMDVESSGDSQLPSAQGHEPRSVAGLIAKPWEDKQARIAFGGTHLCHQSETTRIDQCKAIIKAIDKRIHPAILAGDFNFTPGSEPYNTLIDAGFVDTAAAFGDPQPTSPASNPSKRIDYVFVRPADRWRVIDVTVLDEPVASDHAPLLVELEYVQP